MGSESLMSERCKASPILFLLEFFPTLNPCSAAKQCTLKTFHIKLNFGVHMGSESLMSERCKASPILFLLEFLQLLIYFHLINIIQSFFKFFEDP